MQFQHSRVALALTGLTYLATSVACGGSAPEMGGIGDQVVAVGEQLVIELRATDSDGDDLEYSYATDVPNIETRATMSRSPAGYGVFQWTPQGADVGEWFFDFVASDGSDEAAVTVKIDVRSATGSASAPRFASPQGHGTYINDRCLDLDIVVVDQDSASVIIAQEEPLIEGATLEATSGLMAAWRWCPTRAQADAQSRYTLTLSADDEKNPKTILPFVIALKRDPGQNCPGAAPEIAHTAMNVSTVASLKLDARISDDKGLKQDPLLYYSTTPIAPDPDLSAMTQVSMLLIDGDHTDGLWEAAVPNPAVAGGAGASAQLYYVIVADDDDDDTGNCDHTTQSPNYTMMVTNPGGGGDAGLCAPCSADLQCGSGDLCVRVGATQQPFCLEDCTTGSCPAGYACSAAPVTSVEGATARQCVPESGSCSGTTVCVDDSYEQNDTRAQAQDQPGLPPGAHNFISCPASTGLDDDEDWFRLSLAASARLNVTLSGGTNSDLDLGVYASDGGRVSSSTSVASTESISTCVPAGTYYFRVFSWNAEAANPYSINWSSTPETCSSCVDDAREDDDTPSQARNVLTSTNDRICPNDPDVYAVPVAAGDRVVVDLTFNQESILDDLDIHLLDPQGVDTTPCSVESIGTCSFNNGQGSDSNEHAEHVIPATCGSSCTYYVRIEGFDGASNSYSIAIVVQ